MGYWFEDPTLKTLASLIVASSIKGLTTFFKAPHIYTGFNVLPEGPTIGPTTMDVIGPRCAKKRAFVVTDEFNEKNAKKAAQFLENDGFTTSIWAKTLPEAPLENVKECAEEIKAYEPDLIMSVGGGSAMDMLAVTPVHLLAIKKADIKALFAKFPKIAINVAGVLAAKVRRDSSLVEVLSFDQVISRLARLILKQTDAEKSLLPLFNQQDLAAMVGTSRVVVNRSLKVMEDQGAIRLERRRIVVTDRVALENLVK